MRVFVLIDGNNLAHALYRLPPRAKVTPQHDALLVRQLCDWLARQPDGVQVELCLDRRKPLDSECPAMRVIPIQSGHNADDELALRARLHALHHGPCWVITVDGELRERVREYRLRSITVYDFILSVNPTKPVFADVPGDLPRGCLPEDDVPVFKAPLLAPQTPTKPVWQNRNAAEIERIIAEMLARRKQEHAPALPPNMPITLFPNIASETVVGLSILTWPVKPALKFLRTSYCPRHFQHVQPLYESSLQHRPEDLTLLVDMFREDCGVEEDLISRGGSLADKVRLALLSSESMQLSFEEIAVLTGSPVGAIKNKVKQLDGSWFQLKDRCA